MHILCRENQLAVHDVEVPLNPFFHFFHLILISHQSDDDDKLCDQTQEWTQNESNVSSFDVAHSSLSSHAHYRRLIQLASHKLSKQSEICAISISAKSFFQKMFSPLVFPFSSECIYFCFILDIFPLQFFALCCSTFSSHFACIKEDTMREKKVLLLSLSRAASGAPPSLQLDTKRQIKNLKLKHV